MKLAEVPEKTIDLDALVEKTGISDEQVAEETKKLKYHPKNSLEEAFYCLARDFMEKTGLMNPAENINHICPHTVTGSGRTYKASFIISHYGNGFNFEFYSEKGIMHIYYARQIADSEKEVLDRIEICGIIERVAKTYDLKFSMNLREESISIGLGTFAAIDNYEAWAIKIGAIEKVIAGYLAGSQNFPEDKNEK